MLELLILATVAAAGYAGASSWSMPAGAVALTIASWWRKVRLLRQYPQVPFSSKMTTYLVVSIVIYIGLAVASYGASQALRRWLGD
jgi:hypothetical protein